MNKQYINNFSGRLNWDDEKHTRPNSDYEFLLNSVDADEDGLENAKITERSNYLCVSLPEFYSVIGSVSSFLNNKKEEILFLANELGVSSEIGILDTQNCTYTTLINNPCLGFDISKPINALLKIKKNNERIIYFTDTVKDYKVINIDNLSQYPNNDIACDRMLFSPKIKPLSFKAEEILESGSLKLGTYKAYVRYLSKDLAETNIIAESETILIDKHDLGESYFLIDGGYNIGDSNSVSSEQYPLSNKSIKFSLSEVDINFSYIQIEIIGYVNGSGAVSLVEKSDLIPITSPVMSWVYTGLNTTASVASNITINKPIINKVVAHAQKDNYLFIANTEESSHIKYELIQQAALQVKVKWETKGVSKFDRVKGNVKNGIEYKSFMRDEIYALGIQGILEKGDRTPVFHIPGRAKMVQAIDKVNLSYHHRIEEVGPNYNWDEANYGPSSNFSDGVPSFQPHEADHLNMTGDIPRWKLFNTGFVDNVITLENNTLETPPFYVQGQCGYYESSSENYPDIDTPNGKLYGNLTGTPIRHHRMPHTNIVPHVTNRYVYPLNLIVDIQQMIITLQQTYPELQLGTANSKIKKWVIVTGERTEDNKTILDKGFTTQDEGQRSTNTLWMYGQAVASTPTGTYEANNSLIRFYSPKTLFKRKGLNPIYYQVEIYNPYNYLSRISNNNYWMRKLDWAYSEKPDMIREIYDHHGKQSFSFSYTNRLSNFFIKSATYVDASTVVKEKETFIQGNVPNFFNPEGPRNYDYTPHKYILKFNSNYGNYINNPENRAPWDGTTTPPILNGTEWKAFFTYGSLKRTIEPYNNLSQINYYEMPQYANILTTGQYVFYFKGGDTFITPMSVEISGLTDTENDPPNISTGGSEGSYTMKHVHHDIYYMWVESDINTAYRHSKNIYNKKDDDIYYKGWVATNANNTDVIRFETTGNQRGFEEYLYQQLGTTWQGVRPDPTNMDIRCFKPSLLYNSDYGNFYGIKPYFGLSYFYDFFNYKNKNKYIIRYSDKDTQETIMDNYRIFRPNNFVNIDAQNGEIIDLFVDKSELFARTYKSLLLVPTNIQTIKTNETSIYLGKGDVIPYAPKAINNLNYIYGGGLNFKDRIVTEFGTVLTDIRTSKIYLLREGLIDISDKMYSFFNKFYRSDLVDKNISNAYDRTTLYYDPYNKRLNFTFKVYKFLDSTKEKLNNGWTFSTDNTGLIIFDDPNSNPLEGGYVIDINSICYAQEYTISYSFKKNKWVSFHSYKPSYALTLNNGFLTIKKTALTKEEVWLHEFNNDKPEKPFLNYYNNYYPFVLEFSLNEDPLNAKILNNISINSLHNKWNHFAAYTQRMHTNKLALLPKKQDDNLLLSEMESDTVPIISSKDDDYNISDVKDKVININNPIWQYNDRYDKIINSSNINNQLNMNQGFIKDKLINIQLYYECNDNKKEKQAIWLVKSSTNVINR